MEDLSQTSQPYRLEVLVHGHPVKTYQALDGKICIEGRMGSPYTLRIHNDSGARVLFIPSVDGLSAINGKRANAHSSGYVVEPRQYVDVKGWRISLEQVAQFLFGKIDAAYAAQMDKPDNVGVIGVMVFREKIPVPVLHLARSESSDSFGGTAIRRVKQGMGTGWGQTVQDPAHYTEFDRMDSPVATLLIYYDDLEGLFKNYDISLREEPKVATNGTHVPEAFEFCTPPPNAPAVPQPELQPELRPKR